MHKVKVKDPLEEIGRFILAIISSVGILLFYARQTHFGKGDFNKEIRDTRNMIAYVMYVENKEKPGKTSHDIYLLHSQTGSQYQLTHDKFSYRAVSWSPKGHRILFNSSRSLEKYSYRNNQRRSNFSDYLYIYDFRKGKEQMLEKTLRQSVYNMGMEYKKEGTWNSPYDDLERKHCSNMSPVWFDENLISFKRQLPYGIRTAPGVLCSTDTLGKQLKIYRDLYYYPKWEFICQQWINSDTLLACFRPFDVEEKRERIGYYLVKDREIVFLSKEDEKRRPFLNLSRDKKKFLYTELEKGKDSGNLFVQNRITGKIEFLVENVREAVFSPLGEKIAFIRDSGTFGNRILDIYIMDSDGSNIKQMTFDGCYKWSLSWCPNSDE